MASLYERRRADRRAERLGLDVDAEGLGPQPGVTIPDDSLVSGAIEAKLNQPPRATGATTAPVSTVPGQVGGAKLVDPLGPERKTTGLPKQTGVTVPGADTGMDDQGIADEAGGAIDAGLSGVPEASMDWRKSLSYGDQGTLIGFRTDGYGGDDEEANTVKNTFGKIASRYKHTPDQVDAILQDPDFRRAFPNATKIEGGANDKIDFGGVLSFFDHGEPVGVVDVQKAADPSTNTSEGWTWQPDGGGGGDAGMGMDAGGGMGITANVDDLTGSDNLADILAQIDALANGRNPAEAEALLRLLNEGGGNGPVV